MNIKRKYFTHKNIQFSYLEGLPDSQPNKTPILLLHGFTASAESNWHHNGWMQKMIEQGFRVIAPDACGHGKSDKIYNSEVYPSSVMIGDSLALLEQLQIDIVNIMGYSMGARMAAFAAINHPKKIKKMVLGGMGYNLHKGVGNAEIIAQALRVDNLKNITNRSARIFRRLAEKEHNDLEALAYCILSSRQKIDQYSLSKIKAKTLVVVGEKDTISGDASQLAEMIPNAISITVKSCNHFDALMKPAFQSSCLDFLFKE